MSSTLVTTFLRWDFARYALARGWWLVTALYLVVEAELSATQLVLIGVFQSLLGLIAEVPAGVFADAISRRRSLVIGHVITGIGMTMTGFVTSFPLLVVSNCLWGLGWAFSSGSDVAWITDELDRPDIIDSVLTAQARWQLRATPVGLVAFGALAAVSTLQTAIVTAGLMIIALGVFVVARWPQTGFAPVDAKQRWTESMNIFRRGISMAFTSRVIAMVLLANVFLHGGEDGFGRLFERRLTLLGMPRQPEPIVWFGAIALIAALFGATTLRIIETRIAHADVDRRAYVFASVAGVVGLVLFAHAPNAAFAVVASMLVRGIASPITRVAAKILVNRRISSDVRATVHSLPAQTEYLGEIVFGVALALLARTASAAVVITACAVLLAMSSAVVAVTPRSKRSLAAEPSSLE